MFETTSSLDQGCLNKLDESINVTIIKSQLITLNSQFKECAALTFMKEGNKNKKF